MILNASAIAKRRPAIARTLSSAGACALCAGWEKQAYARSLSGRATSSAVIPHALCYTADEEAEGGEKDANYTYAFTGRVVPAHPRFGASKQEHEEVECYRSDWC